MKTVPPINTSRLHLCAVQLQDTADIFAYAQNPNVLRYTIATPPQEIAETEAFVRGLINQPDGSYAWAIRLNGTTRVIGIIELGQYDESYAAVDYGLSEDYWNQGIMTEAVQAVIDWAFNNIPNLQAITSAAMTANPASTIVQQKCGMTIRRKEEQKWPKFDKPVEVAISSITKAEWSKE